MKGKTRLKRILGAVFIILILGASYVTYEVIRFNRDMEELGQGLGELGRGLNDLGQGLSALNFSGDSNTTEGDSLKVDPSTIDSTAAFVE